MGHSFNVNAPEFTPHELAQEPNAQQLTELNATIISVSRTLNLLFDSQRQLVLTVRTLAMQPFTKVACNVASGTDDAMQIAPADGAAVDAGIGPNASCDIFQDVQMDPAHGNMDPVLITPVTNDLDTGSPIVMCGGNDDEVEFASLCSDHSGLDEVALLEAELQAQAQAAQVLTDIPAFTAQLDDADTLCWTSGLDGLTMEALLDYDPRAFLNDQPSEAQIEFLLQLHVERTKCSTGEGNDDMARPSGPEPGSDPVCLSTGSIEGTAAEDPNEWGEARCDAKRKRKHANKVARRHESIAEHQLEAAVSARIDKLSTTTWSADALEMLIEHASEDNNVVEVTALKYMLDMALVQGGVASAASSQY